MFDRNPGTVLLFIVYTVTVTVTVIVTVTDIVHRVYDYRLDYYCTDIVTVP